MRKIKLRGREISESKWVYGQYLSIDNRHIIVKGCLLDAEEYLELEDAITQTEVYPDSLGQFTSLKDTLGNEIYEGDILEHRDSSFPPLIVEFKDGSFIAKFKDSSQHKLLSEVCSSCRVIGAVSKPKRWWFAEVYYKKKLLYTPKFKNKSDALKFVDSLPNHRVVLLHRVKYP